MNPKTINLIDGARIAISERVVPHATATAIILHGFFSSRQSANCIAAMDSFAAQGMTAVAADLYGRGDSDGAFGDLTVARGVETVRALIDDIRQRDPDQKIILTGGSYGGLIALHAVAQTPAVDLLILRAPVSDWRATWQGWLSAEKMAAWQLSGEHRDVLPDGRAVTFGRDFYQDICATVYDTVAPRIGVPTLIVHGTADETVPLSQSEKLHGVLPHSELVTLDGADHQFKQPAHLAAYQKHIVAFLRKNDFTSAG